MESDLGLLPAIEQAAAQLFAGYGGSESDDALVSEDAEALARALAEGRVWVAAFHGEPVGFALATIVDGCGHVHEIDVLPRYGRHGLGRALMDAVCAWAAGRRFPAVTLSTRLDVPFNGPFYARLGFAVLRDAQLTPGLRRLRTEEAARGLAIDRRAIMRLTL